MSGDLKSLIKSSQAVLSKACDLFFPPALESQHASFRVTGSQLLTNVPQASNSPISTSCLMGLPGFQLVWLPRASILAILAYSCNDMLASARLPSPPSPSRAGTIDTWQSRTDSSRELTFQTPIGFKVSSFMSRCVVLSKLPSLSDPQLAPVQNTGVIKNQTFLGAIGKVVSNKQIMSST